MKRVINKAYKSEIFINNELKKIFKQFMDNRRFIYNQTLSIIEKLTDDNYPIKHYIDNNGKKISIQNKKNLQFIGKMLNDSYDFLNLSHSQSNQEAIHSLHKAWSNWKDPNLKNFDKPKFKKRKSINSFFIPNQNNIDINLNDNSIYIKPFDRYLKKILDNKNLLNNYNKIILKNKVHKDFFDKEVRITGITISKDKYDRFYLSINYKYEIEIFELNEKHLTQYIQNKSKRIIGIDLGLKDKLILSDGRKFKGINNSKKYKEIELDKKKIQRNISKKVENRKKTLINKKRESGYKSINKKELKKLLKTKKKDKYIDIPKKIDLYKLHQENKLNILKKDYRFNKQEWKYIYNNDEIKKNQRKVYRLEQKLKNIKNNENHHISKFISENFDFIFMEDLTLKGMQSLWGNKIKVLGLNQLTEQIKYKAENQGKIFVQIDRFYPSSKTCCQCGNVKKDLKLSDREYQCLECDNKIDRDIQAGINIMFEGINQSLEKRELMSVFNDLRDLKNQLVGMSKVVDHILT